MNDKIEKSKHPRTLHLPWSPGKSSDDKVLKFDDCFSGKHIVVTEKLDGENTTLYNDYIHARSVNSNYHSSREWIYTFHAQIKEHIPNNIKLVIENLYAVHSIKYNNLKSYCYGLFVWDYCICLDWENTNNWFNKFNIPLPNILYKGLYDKKEIIKLENKLDFSKIEGYVIRNTKQFDYIDFNKNVAKYVRKNHIQTNEHWLNKEVIKNNLKGEFYE